MEEFDLRKIFQVFYKRKNIILMVVMVAVVIALVFSLLSPKIYLAKGTMLVHEHMNEGSQKVKVDPQWYVSTQMELMRSHGVVKRVAKMWVNKHKLYWGNPREKSKKVRAKYTYKIPTDRFYMVGKNRLFSWIGGLIRAVKGGKEGKDEDKVYGLMLSILDHVKVTNKFGSNVFYIIVEADDPQLAAAISNVMMLAYQEENLKLKSEELIERIRKIQFPLNKARERWRANDLDLGKFLTSPKNAPLLKRDLIKERTDLEQKKNTLVAEKNILLTRLSPQSLEVKNKKREIEQQEALLKKLDKVIQVQSGIKNRLKKKESAVKAARLEKTKIEQIKKKLESVNADLVSDAQISDFALEPEGYIKPKMAVNVAIALVASLMFGMALAFFLEFISRMIKNETDLVKSTGSRVFCTFPANTIQSYVQNIQALPEQFRLLRTSLMASMEEGEKSILITGTQKENDNTPFIVSNLALAFSLLEERQIILVDADLRNPRCHEMFGMESTYGLVDYLIGALKDLNAKSTIQPNLKLISVGQICPNPAELLESKKMREVVKMLEQSADIILYCSSSLAAYPDASVLATLTHRIVLTATVDSTSIEDIVRVKDILHHTKSKIVGSVLSNTI